MNPLNPIIDLLVMGDHPHDVLNGTPGVVAIDTETTGLTWEDKLLGISLAWHSDGAAKSCYMIDPRGTNQLPMWGIAGTVSSADLARAIPKIKMLALANHSFDYRFLMKHVAMSPLPNVFDVQHVARHYGVQENGVSLAALYEKYVGKVKPSVSSMKSKRGGLSKMDPETVADYAREDALMTFGVYNALRTNSSLSSYKKFHFQDQRFMHLVMTMVERGIPLDMPHISGRISSYHKRMMELQTELVRMGVANANSTNDVKGYCESKGIPIQNTGAEELERFADMYPALAKIVEFRSLDKAIGSWLGPIHQNGLWDGNLHSMLNPFGTKSYRMSASDPNAQGIPMEERGHRAFGSMFGIFKSDDPEYELWGFDLKQAEMRLAAVLSGDVELQWTISQPGDIYKNLAKLIWDDEGRRQTAKSAQLSAMYEVGVKTFSETYGVTKEEAKDILQQVRAKFPAALRTSKNLTRAMQQTKKVDLVTGRPRWMTKIEIEEEQFYKAFNQRVQGSLAELMDRAMLYVEEALPGRMVLQVHDSIILKISKDKARMSKEFDLVAQCMQQSVDQILHGYKPLPFPIDPKPYQEIT